MAANVDVSVENVLEGFAMAANVDAETSNERHRANVDAETSNERHRAPMTFKQKSTKDEIAKLKNEITKVRNDIARVVNAGTSVRDQINSTKNEIGYLENHIKSVHNQIVEVANISRGAQGGLLDYNRREEVQLRSMDEQLRSRDVQLTVVLGELTENAIKLTMEENVLMKRESMLKAQVKSVRTSKAVFTPKRKYSDVVSLSTLKMAPSSMTRSNVKSIQSLSREGGPEYLNYCPSAAQVPIPLALANSVFGDFLDIFRGRHKTFALVKEDYEFVVEFSRKVTSLYDTHDIYVEVLMDNLNMYLGSELRFRQEVKCGAPLGYKDSAADMGVLWSVYQDGNNENAIPVCFCEAKMSIAGSMVDPYFQGIQCYSLFWEYKRTTKKHIDVHDETCCPLLLIEFVGTFMRISALARLKKVCCQPLTPFVNLLEMQGVDTDMVLETARALRALKETLKLLVEFYKHSPRVPTNVLGDFVRQNIPCRLQISYGHPHPAPQQIFPNKLLYRVAHACASKKYVVKYSNRYGEAVHRAWADASLAPQLVACEKLPGGWFEVTMEDLSEEEGWTTLYSRCDSEKLRPYVLQKLKEAHKLEVGRGLGVHGDARDVNVLVKDGASGLIDVRFIDFDWAGVVGDAYYPPFLNHNHPWAEDVVECGPMLQLHDMKLLSNSQNSTR